MAGVISRFALAGRTDRLHDRAAAGLAGALVHAVQDGQGSGLRRARQLHARGHDRPALLAVALADALLLGPDGAAGDLRGARRRAADEPEADADLGLSARCS